MFNIQYNIRHVVQHNPNEKVISNPSQIAINVHPMIILPSDQLLHHTSSRVGAKD